MSEFDKIRILKEKGYFPDTILDIGAYHDILSIMINTYTKVFFTFYTFGHLKRRLLR
jgi:hypothetical protein